MQGCRCLRRGTGPARPLGLWGQDRGAEPSWELTLQPFSFLARQTSQGGCRTTSWSLLRTQVPALVGSRKAETAWGPRGLVAAAGAAQTEAPRAPNSTGTNQTGSGALLPAWSFSCTEAADGVPPGPAQSASHSPHPVPTALFGPGCQQPLPRKAVPEKPLQGRCQLCCGRMLTPHPFHRRKVALHVREFPIPATTKASTKRPRATG